MTKLTDEELMDIDDYGNRELYTRAEVLMARELLDNKNTLGLYDDVRKTYEAKLRKLTICLAAAERVVELVRTMRLADAIAAAKAYDKLNEVVIVKASLESLKTHVPNSNFTVDDLLAAAKVLRDKETGDE
jgi:hypothetical protein